MTVQSETNKVVYIGDGVTKIFAIPFYFFDKQINVYINYSKDPFTDWGYILRNPEGYAGGEIEFYNPPIEGTVITIMRKVDLKQLITFLEGEDFPAKDYEYALDKLTMALQQVHECLERAVLVPHGAEITGEDLFHCLELLHKYWDRVMAVPEYVDRILDSTTDNIQNGDMRLATANSVYQYAYSRRNIEDLFRSSVHKLRNNQINISPDTVLPNEGNEEYPYKYNIEREEVHSGHCPVVMFNQTDALSGNFAPYADCYAGGVTIYLKSDSPLSTTIPLILLV